MIGEVWLASIAVAHARSRAASRSQLHAELEQAHNEIALLREELSIKDGRWDRSRTRRQPHYTPIQWMRILQLRAARGHRLRLQVRYVAGSRHLPVVGLKRAA